MHFCKSAHWGLGLSYTVNDLDQPITVIMYDVYTPFRLQRSYEINWTKRLYTFYKKPTTDGNLGKEQWILLFYCFLYQKRTI